MEAVAVLVSTMPRMRADLPTGKLGQCCKTKPDFVKVLPLVVYHYRHYYLVKYCEISAIRLGRNGVVISLNWNVVRSGFNVVTAKLERA